MNVNSIYCIGAGTYANVDDLVRDFNYEPDTSIKIGIEKFISWY